MKRQPGAYCKADGDGAWADRSAAIAHMRFDFIEKVCAETVIKPHESKEHLRSQKMDKNTYRQIYSHSMLRRYYGACFLADLWRDRKGTFRSSGYGNYLADCSGGSGNDCMERK